MIDERDKNGEYKSFEDFLVRCAGTDVKRNMLESFVLASALDWTGINRASMIATIRTEFEKLTGSNNRQVEGQMSLFEMNDASQVSGPSIRIAHFDEYPDAVKLQYEKDIVGIYLSGHPLSASSKYVERFSTFTMLDLKEYRDNGRIASLNDDRPVIMSGIVMSKKLRTTKNKTSMCVLTMEDMYGQYEAVLFGRILDEYIKIVEPNEAYLIAGKRRVRGEDQFSLAVDEIIRMPSSDETADEVEKRPCVRTALAATDKLIKNDHPRPAGKSFAKPAEGKNPEAPMGMRIRFYGNTTDPKYERLLNLLCYFHGNVPVDIEFVSDGSMMRVDPVCFVSSDPDVVAIIRDFCGEDNVVI